MYDVESQRPKVFRWRTTFQTRASQIEKRDWKVLIEPGDITLEKFTNETAGKRDQRQVEPPKLALLKR